MLGRIFMLPLLRPPVESAYFSAPLSWRAFFRARYAGASEDNQMTEIPSAVLDLLEDTRYGVSFPVPSGCQMRFVHEGVDLGGFYAYSQYDGILKAVQAAIIDNKALRDRYRRRPDGKRPYRFQRAPHGTTGVVGVSCGPYFDPRRDKEAYRYQVSWRQNESPRSKTFHLSASANADQHLHAFRTAIQFRKEWEMLLGEFDPTKYKFWRTRRLYEPGHPALPLSYWDKTVKIRVPDLSGFRD